MWYENLLLGVCLGQIVGICVVVWLHSRDNARLHGSYTAMLHDLHNRLMARSLGEYQVQRKIEEGKTFPSIGGSDAEYAEIERRRKGGP